MISFADLKAEVLQCVIDHPGLTAAGIASKIGRERKRTRNAINYLFEKDCKIKTLPKASENDFARWAYRAPDKYPSTTLLATSWSGQGLMFLQDQAC